MNTIDGLERLEALYGSPAPRAVDKVRSRITPRYRRWLAQSRFCVLTTVGPQGTDASPRGDVGPVVRIVDDRTLHLPDWRGNDRIDSLRNIVVDGRVSLLFMIHGCDNVVRVNGRAVITADADVTGTFEEGGRHPRTVVVVRLEEVYFQCAKALMRAALWDPSTQGRDLPTAGEFVQEADPDFDGASYDAGYADYARMRLW